MIEIERSTKYEVKELAIRIRNASYTESRELFDSMQMISRKMYYIANDKKVSMSPSELKEIKGLMEDHCFDEQIIREFQLLIDSNNMDIDSRMCLPAF
jgi:hypothetical protein